MKTVERRYQQTIDNLAADNALLERKIHVSKILINQSLNQNKKTESELSTLRPLTMQTQQSIGSIGVCTNCNQKQATHVLSCGHLGKDQFYRFTLII